MSISILLLVLWLALLIVSYKGALFALEKSDLL